MIQYINTSSLLIHPLTHAHIHTHTFHIPIYSTEEPSPKRPKCDSAVGGDLVEKRLALACSAHTWLPTVLPTTGDERTAVVAMATRSGHVILWRLQVPLPARRYAVHKPWYDAKMHGRCLPCLFAAWGRTYRYRSLCCGPCSYHYLWRHGPAVSNGTAKQLVHIVACCCV